MIWLCGLRTAALTCGREPNFTQRESQYQRRTARVLCAGRRVDAPRRLPNARSDNCSLGWSTPACAVRRSPFEPVYLSQRQFELIMARVFSHVAIGDIARLATACKPAASKATMSFLFDEGYYAVGKNGVSPFQNMHVICVQSKRASASDDTSFVGAHTLAVRPFKPSATTRSPRTASSCSNTRGRRVRREFNAPSTLSSAGQGPRGQHREPEGRPGRGQRRLQKEPDQRVAVRPSRVTRFEPLSGCLKTTPLLINHSSAAARASLTASAAHAPASSTQTDASKSSDGISSARTAA